MRHGDKDVRAIPLSNDLLSGVVTQLARFVVEPEGPNYSKGAQGGSNIKGKARPWSFNSGVADPTRPGSDAAG